MSSYIEKKTLRKFNAGTVIFKENQPGHSMYIITAGKVEVSTIIDDKEIILAHLGQGAMFGEMALLGDRIRSATIKAETEVICYEINRILFKKQLENLPAWLKTLFKVIVDRLKEANKKHTTIGKVEIRRQVVNLLDLLIRTEGKEHMGSIYIPWRQSVDSMCFLLNLQKEKVEKIMNQLTMNHLATSKIGNNNNRVFMVENMEEFEHFAEYCKMKYKQDLGEVTSEDFSAKSKEEMQVLHLVKRFSNTKMGGGEVRVDLFNAELELSYERDASSFSKSIKQIIACNILQIRVDKQNEKYYTIDRDLLYKRLTINEKIGSFAKLEEALG